jgi:hypothetical protein
MGADITMATIVGGGIADDIINAPLGDSSRLT